MFYYYGRKKRLAKLYPEPEFKLIIEPFAGSAAYSLHGKRWENQVVINDLSREVTRAWRYLQQATLSDIQRLPEPPIGSRLSDITWLSAEERWIISQHINPGADQRSDVVQKFNRWPAGKRYIMNSLHKIKHWTILGGEYSLIANKRATWFVDPPYERSGVRYRNNTVDYSALQKWCMCRSGQLIVCEQSGADWLPFQSLAEIAICGTAKSKEMVYVRHEGIEGPMSTLPQADVTL